MNTPAEFAAVYDAEHYRIFGICRRMVGDPDVAEDLAAQIWLRAWAAWPAYRPDVPVGAWLSRIARNIALDWLRGATRRARGWAPPDWWQAVAPDDPAGAVVAAESVAEAQALLARLLPQQRVVLQLMVAGYSQREIGTRLGVSASAVKSSVWRARAQCRAWATEEVV